MCFTRFLTGFSACIRTQRFPCRGNQFSRFRISRQDFCCNEATPLDSPFVSVDRATTNDGFPPSHRWTARKPSLLDILPSLSRRAENVIPKRRADAVSGVIILVMMAKVILLQPKPGAPLHGKMIRRVILHVIADITENQPGTNSRRHTPKNQNVDGVKKKN